MDRVRLFTGGVQNDATTLLPTFLHSMQCTLVDSRDLFLIANTAALSHICCLLQYTSLLLELQIHFDQRLQERLMADEGLDCILLLCGAQL